MPYVAKLYRIVRAHSTHSVYRQIQVYSFPRLPLLHSTLNLLFPFFVFSKTSPITNYLFTPVNLTLTQCHVRLTLLSRNSGHAPLKILFRNFYYKCSPSVLIIVSENVLNARCCVHSCSPPFSGRLPSFWVSALFWLMLCASYLQGAHRLYRPL